MFSFVIMQIKAPPDIYMGLYSYLMVNWKELNIKTVYFKYFNFHKKLSNTPYLHLLHDYFSILLHDLRLKCDWQDSTTYVTTYDERSDVLLTESCEGLIIQDVSSFRSLSVFRSTNSVLLWLPFMSSQLHLLLLKLPTRRYNRYLGITHFPLIIFTFLNLLCVLWQLPNLRLF